MPIDIHGLAKRYESIPGLDLQSVKESVKEFRATLQGRKKELLKPFGLDDLDKFKDNPDAFMKMVSFAVDSLKEKREQNAPYRILYEDSRCLVTFTSKPEGATAAGSHLKTDGEVRCPWCICVKHPDNEKWWRKYQTAALVFIYTEDDACCILLTARDALKAISGNFAYSQVEGIENNGLNDKPEEQRKVLERLYGKTGLSDARLVELLHPVLESMRRELEKNAATEELFTAVEEGKIERVRESLTQGADVCAQTKCGFTPLHFAALYGRLDICKMLIDSGAVVDARNNYGENPLFPAAEFGYLEVCKLLIDAGANVDNRDKSNRTPLFSAVFCGNLELCKLFIESGARVDIRDILGLSPLYIARKNGYEKITELLLQAGAQE